MFDDFSENAFIAVVLELLTVDFERLYGITG